MHIWFLHNFHSTVTYRLQCRFFFGCTVYSRNQISEFRLITAQLKLLRLNKKWAKIGAEGISKAMSRSQPKKNRLRNNGRAVIVFVATVHPLQVVAAKQHFKNLAKHEILTKLFLINKFAKFPMNSAKFSQNMKYFYLKKLKYIHIRENPHFLVIMQYIAVIDTYIWVLQGCYYYL